MFTRLNFVWASVILCALIQQTQFCGNAWAETSTDRVLEKIAALEARVAALESKNKEYQREVEEARTQTRVANAELLRLFNSARFKRRVGNGFCQPSRRADDFRLDWRLLGRSCRRCSDPIKHSFSPARPASVPEQYTSI